MDLPPSSWQVWHAIIPPMMWAEPSKSNEYQVSTEVYEGPLDLLLDLIERAELDITTLSLAQVTDQYIAHLQQIQEQNAANVSAFIVIAAKLIQIKSLALLPHTPAEMAEGEEEDPGEALTRQLILYKKFKTLGNYLDQRTISGYHTYLRLAPPVKIQGKVNLEGVTLSDLLDAARSIFLSKNTMLPLSDVVTRSRFTIRERIRYILDSLKTKQKISFRYLLTHKENKLEIVITFLAMLELIKRRVIEATQEIIFGDISLQPIVESEISDEEQLEF